MDRGHFAQNLFAVGPINWSIENTSGMHSLRYDSHVKKGYSRRAYDVTIEAAIASLLGRETRHRLARKNFESTFRKPFFTWLTEVPSYFQEPLQLRKAKITLSAAICKVFR